MSLTLATANSIITLTCACRGANLKPLSVVVLDARAALVAAQSEDGVSIMRAAIAHGKAMGRSSLAWGHAH